MWNIWKKSTQKFKGAFTSFQWIDWHVLYCREAGMDVFLWEKIGCITTAVSAHVKWGVLNSGFSTRFFKLDLFLHGENVDRYRLLTSIKWCHTKKTCKHTHTRRSDSYKHETSDVRWNIALILYWQAFVIEFLWSSEKRGWNRDRASERERKQY